MHLPRWIIVSLWLGLIIRISAFGQNDLVDNKEKLPPQLIDPSNTSPVSSPIATQSINLSLAASKDDKSISSTYGLRIHNDYFINMKLSSPISQSESQTRPFTLDGLGKSAVVDIGIKYLSWHPSVSYDDMIKQHEIIKKINKRLGKKENDVIQQDEWKQFPSERKDYDGYIKWGISWLGGINIKVGREDFSYADSALVETKIQKTNVAIGASFGLLSENNGYYGVNYQTTTAFSGKDESQYLIPFNNSGVLVSKTIAIGEPQKSTKTFVQFEYRKYIGGNIALNPKISFVLKDKIFALELPIYFLQSPEGGLNGGIDMGWNTKDHRFSIGAFVGDILGIVP